MSFYNMLFGYNPLGAAYLAMLGLTPREIPRYRDVYLKRLDDGQIGIVVYTRSGGGNREEYQAQNDELGKHPLYVSDWDDEFDSTFANFLFRAPEEFRDQMETLILVAGQAKVPEEEWKRLIAKMESGVEDEETKAVLASAKPLLDKIIGAIDDGQNAVIVRDSEGV